MSMSVGADMRMFSFHQFSLSIILFLLQDRIIWEIQDMTREIEGWELQSGMKIVFIQEKKAFQNKIDRQE